MIIHNRQFALGLLAFLFIVKAANAQNVGIGVATPQSKLSINGTTSSGGLAIGDSTYTSTPSTVAPTDGAIIQGFTSIGTTKTRGRLTVVNDNGRNGGLNAQASLVSYGGGSAAVTDYETYNARGTEAAPTNLANGDSLGGIFYNGFVNNTATVGLSGVGSTYRGDGTTALSDMTFSVSGATFMYLDSKGHLGIDTGLATPVAPLQVGGWTDIINNSTDVFFNFGSLAFGGGPPPVVNQANFADAIFGHNVWCAESYISYSGTIQLSDARLKNIIGQSDSAKDLETLEKIEVTNYTMKDIVKFGNKPLKRVIAQQVEKVYPTAVTSTGIKGFTFTPDVYAVSDSVKTEKPGVYMISLAKAHDLKDGDTVRLITPKIPELNLVAHVVNDKAFTVETKEPLGDKVFVYGKECTDLKAVDYDAIAMLNVSATQELAKKVEALELENSRLRAEAARLSALETQNAKLVAKMEALEKLVAASHEKSSADAAIQTVVLNH